MEAVYLPKVAQDIKVEAKKFQLNATLYIPYTYIVEMKKDLQQVAVTKNYLIKAQHHCQS